MRYLNSIPSSTMMTTLFLLLPSASDSVGSFTLRGIKLGEYRFVAACLGYTTLL